MKPTAIKYPQPVPPHRIISYESPSHPAMIEARKIALERSHDKALKAGVVLIKDSVIIGRGSNDSDYHLTHICERVRLGIPTGQGYDKCEGCHPKNHAEPRAIAEAKANGNDTTGADLYLWGHWWVCQDCWAAIDAAGIRHVFLLEGSEYLFNKDDKDRNILGRW